jgi:hypothetical protein
MSSFFGNGPLPDWNEVKQWLGKEIPWKVVEEWNRSEEGEWLNRFIQGLLPTQERTEAKAKAKAKAKALVQIETVKNAKNLTVTVRVPDHTNWRELRLFAASEHLRVTGLPDQHVHSFRFPCRVYPRSGSASQLDDRIVIDFKRRPVGRDEVELFIRT